MKRPKEHVLEDKSLLIFSQSIPAEWINRPINPDYALDRSIEVVENGNLTGSVFCAQIKGTMHPKVVDDNISFSLEVKYLEYYLQKDVPVVLVVVDVLQEKCYWLFLQHYIYEFLDVDAPTWASQRTIAIHIPLKNEITKTVDQLKDIAKGGPTYIITKKIDKIPTEYLGFWKSNAEAIAGLLATAKKLDKKQLQIRFEVSYRFEKEGDNKKAFSIISDIHKTALASGDKDSCIRAALAMTFHLNPISENAEILQILHRIRKLVEESKNAGYDILWRGIFFETIFAALAKRYNNVLTLHLVASQTPKSMMSSYLSLEASGIVPKIFEIMTEMATCIREAFEQKEFLVYLDLLQRMGRMQYLWCYNNSLGGSAKAIYHNLSVILSIFHFAKNLASRISADYEFSLLLDIARLYGALERKKLCNKTLGEAEALARKLRHKGYEIAVEKVRQSIEKGFTIPFLLKQKAQGVPRKEPTIPDEQEEKMIKHLLEIGGFDKDPELAQLAEIGLRDRNPERILKHCERLHTEILVYGPIWDMVALPSTGTKILYCEKEEKCIIGRELDQILARMKEDSCSKCSSISPRPGEWKWTHEWQRKREKPQRMKTIMKNFFKS
jgi:hypothetical protein